MQSTEQAGLMYQKRQSCMEAVVEMLHKDRITAESLAEVAHDARNMVAALGLYCDLLDEPGVLTKPYSHYGDELRLVASASRRLVQRLTLLEACAEGSATEREIRPHGPVLVSSSPADVPARPQPGGGEWWDEVPARRIENIASELLANRNLLARLAGPGFRLTVECDAGAVPVRMTGEDLTRILVNLVRNAVEAMPTGGSIHLTLRESPARLRDSRWVMLSVEDNGPGIPDAALSRIFEAGYTTRPAQPAASHASPAKRGLGLSITRSLVQAAGGRIHAINRNPSGACFQIYLPAGELPR